MQLGHSEAENVIIASHGPWALIYQLKVGYLHLHYIHLRSILHTRGIVNVITTADIQMIPCGVDEHDNAWQAHIAGSSTWW